jgi:glycosyltransferase involved in cell wall biosynthesis
LRNEAFLADLEQLDPAAFGPDDLFLFTFVMNYELGGIMRFARRFETARAPVFLVLLQFDNGLAVAGDEDLDLPLLVRFDQALKKALSGGSREAALVGRLYRHALHQGGPWPGGARVVLMAPSHGLDDLFSAVLHRRVLPYCMPGPLPAEMGPAGDAAHEAPGTSAAGPTVCFLGHSCVRKGLHLVPGIAETTRLRFADVRFEVHVNYNDDYPLKHIFEGLFDREPPGVRFHRGHMDSVRFYSILREADVVLCPYSRDVYAYMPSGLLREALALGKVVVLPAGTSLERQARSVDAGFVSFPEQTIPAVSRALDAALAHLPALQAQGAAAAGRWVREHNPQRFMEQLLEQAAPAA